MLFIIGTLDGQHSASSHSRASGAPRMAHIYGSGVLHPSDDETPETAVYGVLLGETVWAVMVGLEITSS
jgi:hypothetical protein